MNQPAMQFYFGDRELVINIQDLLSAPVDVIVNPANSGLSHGGGIAGQIVAQAGESVQQDSDRLIQEYGEIESGMAVYTAAGQLPYEAVIHAVGPRMGEGDEQRKIEQAVSRSLLICETNGWASIAFPAISTGIFSVPVETCAQAFYRAITRFWDARQECSVEKVIVCLTENKFRPFFDAFREEGIETNADETLLAAAIEAEKEEPVGYVDLSEHELEMPEDDEVNSWFK